MTCRSRRAWSAVLLACAVAPAIPLTAVAAPAAPRIVVLGFDGADPRLLAQYREQGLLPNIDELAREGSLAALTPTNPPQSPVSWASFATGLNPGRTEIFDLVQRRAGQYVPDVSLVTPGRRVFIYGEWNGWVFAGFIGFALALVVGAVVRLVRVRWLLALPIALVVGCAATAVLAPRLAWLLPAEVPDASNPRRGTPFWTVLARNGLDVRVTHVPLTYPAEQLGAGSRMLSGLGVPDARGTVGRPSIYTSDPNFTLGDNEFRLEAVRLPERRGVIDTVVVGPENYPFHQFVVERARERWVAEGVAPAERERREAQLLAQLARRGVRPRIDVPLRLDVSEDELRWEVNDQSGTLKPGAWSDWVVLDFPLNKLFDRVQPVRGMARFKLLALAPEVQLYLSPINFHPSCHPVAYSWPPNWAEQLAGNVGLFKTIGWSIDTWSYPSGVGGIDLFLEDMWATVDASTRILERALRHRRVDAIVQVFDFPDRAGHMLWHELDEGHPLYRPELAPKYRQATQDVYVRMDQIIGRAREAVGPDALFLVVSDHGFTSFRRQISYNAWLRRKGLLVLRDDAPELSRVDVSSGIDWGRTRAWAMGLGSIYINLRGREPQGQVMPGEEYDRLVEEIRTGLESEIDAMTGERPVSRVYRPDEVYHGYDPAQIPDLRASNRENYRVSRHDALGGLAAEVFADNDQLWSGDHSSVEPGLVPGFLLVNRRLHVSNPTIIDIAPSILHDQGLQPVVTDGRQIW